MRVNVNGNDRPPTRAEAEQLIRSMQVIVDQAWAMREYLIWWLASGTLLGFRIGGWLQFREWIR